VRAGGIITMDTVVTAKTGSGEFDLPEFSLDCMAQSKISLTGGEILRDPL